jgi:hypothetical protein
VDSQSSDRDAGQARNPTAELRCGHGNAVGSNGTAHRITKRKLASTVSFLAWRASHAPFCTALTTRRYSVISAKPARARIELAFNAFAAILGTVSATIASVVIKSPAIDDASCRAQRTTLAGSITPWRRCGQSDVGRRAAMSCSKNLSVHRASPTTASLEIEDKFENMGAQMLRSVAS